VSRLTSGLTLSRRQGVSLRVRTRWRRSGPGEDPMRARRRSRPAGGGHPPAPGPAGPAAATGRNRRRALRADGPSGWLAYWLRALCAAAGIRVGCTARLALELAMTVPLVFLVTRGTACGRYWHDGLTWRAALYAVAADVVSVPVLRLMIHEFRFYTSTLRRLAGRWRHGVGEGLIAVRVRVRQCGHPAHLRRRFRHRDGGPGLPHPHCQGSGKVAFMQPEGALASAAGRGRDDGWRRRCCPGPPDGAG
jgi:hypothetical protein